MFKPTKSNQSFTLVELLVVVALVAILATVVIIALNPSELIRQARDSRRLSDLSILNRAINMFIAETGGSGFYGSSSVVYVSVPDTSPTCSNLGLPTLPSGWSYHCAPSSTLQNIDGNGWIPINFNLQTFGRSISKLPIDPINTTSSGNYYTYVTGGSFKLTSRFESQKYVLQHTGKDGGPDLALYETGTDLSLAPFVGGLVGYWPFDEGSGTITYDLSGANNNLTILASSSMVIWTPGKLNYGLKYNENAPTNCVNGQFGIYKDDIRSGNILYNLPQNDFSVVLWDNYYPGATTFFHLNTQYCGNGFCGFWINSGASNANNNSVQNTYFYFPAGQNNIWHMYTYVFQISQNIHKMYVDGELKSSGNLSGSYGNVSAINIGIYRPDCVDAAKGTTFDDVRVYNRALSGAEIQAIYDATK